ncbi:MAG: ADP-ribosylglycohydrolase family protein [Lentisphaeria bacterium]
MNNLYDKIYGCYLGKTIGGTLGMPYEGSEEFLDLTYYRPVPTQPMPNDDVDLQLVWLEAFKAHGTALSADDLAGYWQRHIDAHFDEYGIALWNIRRGLKPPLTGIHNNFFKHSMGAAIRSEIWAALFPGRPLAAAHYAWLDASVDHWDEGVYAEVFLAAAQSDLYTSGNLPKSLEFALGLLPEVSQLKAAVADLFHCFDSGMSYEDVRDRAMKRYGNVNFTDCVMNLAFIVIGLLYGKGEFEASLLYAVNCGQDADCTGATTGAFLGILLGKDGIPEKWASKVGATFAVGDYIKGITVHSDLEKLTRDILRQHESAAKQTPEIHVPFTLPEVTDISDNVPWTVEGETLRFDGITLDHEKFEHHVGKEIHFRTTVTFPHSGQIQLMIASRALFKCYWQRQYLGFKGDLARPVPAIHRVRGGRCFPLEVEKGRTYVLEIVLLPTFPVPDLHVAWGDMSMRYVTVPMKNRE